MADIFFGKFSELISRETNEIKKDESETNEIKKKTQSETKSFYWITLIIITSSVILWFLLN